MGSGNEKKLFGITGTWSGAGISMFNPYEAVARNLPDVPGKQNIELTGLFVPDIPETGNDIDINLILSQLKSWVSRHILPAEPILIAFEHGISLAVVRALSSYCTPEELSVIVIDRHLDSTYNSGSTVSDIPSFCTSIIDTGTILPENLACIGVEAYPDGSEPEDSLPDSRKYIREYKQKGVHFFPLENFAGDFEPTLKQFIYESITTPYVYVSMDISIGTINEVYASRYSDGAGLTSEQIATMVHLIKDACVVKGVEMTGFDITGFNREYRERQNTDDKTFEVIRNYIARFTSI